MNSPSYITRTLAERTIVPKDYVELNEWYKAKCLDSGTAVVEVAFLYDSTLKFAKDKATSWYRSRDKKGGINPFGSFMINKKWTLEEEFNNQMLRFQQAGLVAIEVGFKEEPEDQKPEPLEMEHFYFPLGLWGAGLVISVICLLAEIIVYYCRKRSNRDVLMSTPEVKHNSNVDDIEDTEA